MPKMLWKLAKQVRPQHDYNVNIDAFNIFEPFFNAIYICIKYIQNFCLWEVFSKKAFIDVCDIVLVPLLISSGKKNANSRIFNIKYFQFCLFVCYK